MKFKNIIVGLFIGISNVVPGISGGTIACVFSVYEDMLILPSLDIAKFKIRWKSILSLYIGMAFGILAFSKVVHYVYEKFPVYTSYFFVGVIFASLFFLYDEASKDSKKMKLGSASICFKFILFILALTLMLLIYVLKKRGVVFSFDNSSSRYFMSFYVRLALYCAISAAGMIIPGISGAFLLLLFGVYQTVISAVANLEYNLLVSIVLGVAIGAILASRGIKFLLENFRSYTYAFILGLTLGSAFHIFPIVCQPFMQRFISAFFLLLGYVIVTIFLRFENIKGEEV